MKKHKFHSTHIEHHKDGSHTVHHMHEDGPEKDKKYATSDHDGMMDGIMDHTSAPNPGEGNDMHGEPMGGAAAPPPSAAPMGQ